MSDLNRQLFDHVHNAGQSDVTRIITSGAHTLAPYERHVNVVMTGPPSGPSSPPDGGRGTHSAERG